MFFKIVCQFCFIRETFPTRKLTKRRLAQLSDNMSFFMMKKLINKVRSKKVKKVSRLLGDRLGHDLVDARLRTLGNNLQKPNFVNCTSYFSRSQIIFTRKLFMKAYFKNGRFSEYAFSG